MEQPSQQNTNPQDPNEERLVKVLQQQLPRMIEAALSYPKTQAILFQYMNALLPKLDTYNNWNNDNSQTNGENWLIQTIAPNCTTIVDVGANKGDWTQHCLSINDQLNMYCVEASPVTAKLLVERYHDVPNVKLLNIGLGDQEKKLKFYDYGPGAGLSGFVFRKRTYEPQNIIEIPCKKIIHVEEFKKLDRIDFIKIDTEGFEMPIIRSMPDWLQKKKFRLIQFEYGGTWADAREFLFDAYKIFNDNGYLFGKLMQNHIAWIDHFDYRYLETFKYSNFIACASHEDAAALGIQV